MPHFTYSVKGIKMKKQMEVRIKYDKRQMSVIKAAAIVATIMFVLSIVLMFMEIRGTEILTFFLLYIGGGGAVFCYAALVAGGMYMRRLKAYGYQIPEKKSDYDGRLEKLPRQKIADVKSIYSRHSKGCFLACILLFAVFVILDVYYLFKWKFMGDNCKSLFILCFIFYLIWIVFALALKKQSNVEKYRDDVEVDASRKERWSLEQILFTMIILCLLSLFANSTAHSMTRYIFNSMVDHDVEQANVVCRNIICAIEECENVTYTESYAELCEGIDITTWSHPEDELQSLIAEKMYIDDFSHVRDDFKVSDGNAQVFVKIMNKKVAVRLLNPIKEVSQYSTRYMEIYVESDFEK